MALHGNASESSNLVMVTVRASVRCCSGCSKQRADVPVAFDAAE